MPESQYKQNGPSGREWGRICATLEGLQKQMGELLKDQERMADEFANFRQRFFVMGALILGIGIGIGLMISPALASVLIRLMGISV